MATLSHPQHPANSENWLDLVRQQVTSLQFGTVEIVVHEARVVQIEKTERLRLGPSESDKGRRSAVSSLPTRDVAAPDPSHP
jgi:hypothetical protein